MPEPMLVKPEPFPVPQIDHADRYPARFHLILTTGVVLGKTVSELVEVDTLGEVLRENSNSYLSRKTSCREILGYYIKRFSEAADLANLRETVIIRFKKASRKFFEMSLEERDLFVRRAYNIFGLNLNIHTDSVHLGNSDLTIVGDVISFLALLVESETLLNIFLDPSQGSIGAMTNAFLAKRTHFEMFNADARTYIYWFSQLSAVRGYYSNGPASTIDGMSRIMGNFETFKEHYKNQPTTEEEN